MKQIASRDFDANLGELVIMVTPGSIIETRGREADDEALAEKIGREIYRKRLGKRLAEFKTDK